MGTGRQFCLTNCLRSVLSWWDFLLFSTSASGESSPDFSLKMSSAHLCLSHAGSCPFIELSVLIHKSRLGREAPFPILGHIFVLMFLARLVFSSRMRHHCFMLLYVSYPSLSYRKLKPILKMFVSFLMIFLVSDHLLLPVREFFPFKDWVFWIFHSSYGKKIKYIFLHFLYFLFLKDSWFSPNSLDSFFF